MVEGDVEQERLAGILENNGGHTVNSNAHSARSTRRSQVALDAGTPCEGEMSVLVMMHTVLFLTGLTRRWEK